jgi:ATP-dependent RNA helicase RhlE
LLFSATYPQAVGALADSLLHEPVRITIAKTAQTEPHIEQRAIEVDAAQRTQLLRHLVQTENWPRALVFVATKYAADLVATKLYKAGIYATPFHGDLSQSARERTLDEFKDSRWQVMVTTDLAARGVDVVDMPVVVNYDLPRSPNDYTHRIGRTARAGRTGVAITFVSSDTQAHFALIEKCNGLAVAREQVAGFEPKDKVPSLSATDLAPVPGTGGIKGKRPSKKDKLRAAAQQALVAPTGVRRD